MCPWLAAQAEIGNVRKKNKRSNTGRTHDVAVDLDENLMRPRSGTVFTCI